MKRGKQNKDNPKPGQLRAWWIPQVPMSPFYVPVGSPAEAKKLLTVLADYDAFQLKNHIKPDYCNAGGLEVFEYGEWTDWRDQDTDADIDEWEPKQATA